jgi:hypothetical protein
VGSGELSDGRYVWPEGLAHYVAEHGVRLPNEFVHHVLAGPASTAEGIGSKNFDTIVDDQWWRAQTGWYAATSFLTPGFGGRLWLRVPPNGFQFSVLVRLLRALRSIDHARPPGLRRKQPWGALVNVLQLQRRLVRGTEQLLVEGCDYCDYTTLRNLTNDLELEWRFEEREDEMNKSKLAEARRLAAAVIRGDLAMLEAAPSLSKTLFHTTLQNTSIYRFFREVYSETDQLPIGQERVHWAPEALREKDRQAAAYEARIRDRFMSICHELLAYTPESDSK